MEMGRGVLQNPQGRQKWSSWMGTAAENAKGAPPRYRILIQDAQTGNGAAPHASLAAGPVKFERGRAVGATPRNANTCITSYPTLVADHHSQTAPRER